MPINELTPVNEWPTRKLPQDRFDDAVKKAMDQMSVMVDELNENFIPQTNESVKVINKISPNIDTILDAPNQAAAAAASAQAAASSKTAAAQSATEAAASKKAAASSASSASSSKTAATQSATEAAQSASSALGSKNAAAQSASDAAGEADSAAQSASEAAASKNAAASSASSASASKTDAAQSATEAAASAQAAASSKTAAAQSAATAKDEADRAKNEADRAASVAAVDVASDTKAGIVKTDSKTLFVTDTSGTLTAEDVAIDGVLTDTARGRGQIGRCHVIPVSGVDFNTLTKAGRYWINIQALANSTNKPPTTYAGFCDVLGAEGSQKYTKQIYHVFNTPVIYIREHLGVNYSGWAKSWTKIITEKSIATTSEAGLVKPDGVTLEIADATGKMVVKDIAINGNASDLASDRGRFGKLASGVGITSLQSIRVTCDLFFTGTDWGMVTDRPFESKGGAIVSVRSNESGDTNRGHILAKSLATGEMRISYWNENTTSAFRKVITATDIATRSTPGIIKVGMGLTVSGDGTLRYTNMSAATLSVGGNTRLNASSARNFVLTATEASPNVFLPDPTALYAGEQFTFFAEGDNIQVRDFKGQAVGPVLARGKAYLFTLINKTTGEWARAEFSASGTSGENGGSLGFQPSISAPVIFSDVAEAYSTDIELETGRVLHFGASSTSTAGEFNNGTLSLVSVTGWGAVSVKNTPLTLPQDFTLHDFCKLSSSLCCVLAKDTKTNKKFAVILVDVSGATAVVGTANILTTTGTLKNPILSRVDDARALLVYGDGTSLYARLYSFSGATVTAAAPVLVTSPVKNLGYLNVQRMDDTRWLLRTGEYSLQILKVSGTSVTVGEPVTFTPDASWISTSFQAVSPAPGGNVLINIVYQQQEGSTSQNVAVQDLLVYTSSGLVLTEGTLTEISELYTNVMFLNIAGRMFLWGSKTSSTKDYYLVPITINNGTATAGAECLIFTTSESFYKNLTLLTYTGDTYAIISTYKRDDGQLILLKGENFAIASDGSLTKTDPSGPATSISNIIEWRNPCIQAFPGGRYVHAYYRSVGGGTGTTTVSVQNSSWESLCSASVGGFASKPFTAYPSSSTNYLYPSVFSTGEAQALVILNQYNSRKPALALFTL